MITNEQIIKQINKKILKKSLFYVTRYKERGSGLENLLTNYEIITNTPLKDTAEILEKKRLPLGYVIVFKNNVKIQRLAKQKKLKLLNPDYNLVEKYENKVNQYYWLKKIIPANLPKTIITIPSKNSFKNLSKKLGTPFIGQFNRSHSGQGTFLISCTKDWQNLAKKFPKREIKCAEFIKNKTITVNACVWPSSSAGRENCVLVGNPSYQITGLKELTDFTFSTVGNDWSLAQKILKSNDFKIIKALSQKIGQAMIKDGWQGLFGLDFIKSKKWLVIEINARQPASTDLETVLQRKAGQGITIFTAHLAALLNLPLPACAGRPETCSQIQKSLQKIHQGSQIIIRKKKNQNRRKFQKSLYKPLQQRICEGHFVGTVPIKYNAELFRIQNLETGFITKNNQLNSLAKQLLKKRLGT